MTTTRKSGGFFVQKRGQQNGVRWCFKIDTSLDAFKFQQGAGRLSDIVKGLGVFKIFEKGFQMITSSIDMAVSRYDTMQKFPEVLEQMGFGADQAEAATKRLIAPRAGAWIEIW